MVDENDGASEFKNLTLMQRARLRMYAKNPHLLRELFPRDGEPIKPVETPATTEEKKDPSSPLIDLLLRIEKADRGMIWGVHLGKALGYDTEDRFATATKLLESLTLEPTASELKKKHNVEFERALTLEELLTQCVKYPSTIRLNDGEAKITRAGRRIIEVKYLSRSQFKGEPFVDSVVLANLHKNNPVTLTSMALVEPE